MLVWSQSCLFVIYVVEQEIDWIKILYCEVGSGDQLLFSIQCEVFLLVVWELLVWWLGDVCYQFDYVWMEMLFNMLVWDNIGQVDVIGMFVELVLQFYVERWWLFLNIGKGFVINVGEFKVLVDKGEVCGLMLVWISELLDGVYVVLGLNVFCLVVDLLNYDDFLNKVDLDKWVYMYMLVVFVLVFVFVF